MTRAEKTYYIAHGFYNASWSFLAPVYALFLLDRGLDLFEINVVLATFLLVAFLFEVPTGAIADIFGRKMSFLASCAVRAIAFSMYYFSDSFGEFLVAEFVDAIGTTLASGALDAWAIDGMKEEGDSGRIDRFFARSRMLACAVLVVCGLAGGYIATVDLSYPWLFGAFGFCATLVVSAFAMRRDAPPQRNDPDSSRSESAVARIWRTTATSLGDQMRSGVGLVVTHFELRNLCLLTFAAAFAQFPLIQYYQPHMSDLSGGAPWVIGWVWAALSLAALFGSAMMPRLTGRWRRGRVVAVSSLVRAAAVALAASSTRFNPALVGLVVQSAGAGLSEPTVGAWVNDHVDASRRATVLSVLSMSFTIGGAAGLISLGLVGKALGIPAAWFVSALVFLGCAVGFESLRDSSADPVLTVAVEPAARADA
jgi:MFS family permease